nr:gas vesicle protein K [Streptomyces prasinus]
MTADPDDPHAEPHGDHADPHGDRRARRDRRDRRGRGEEGDRRNRLDLEPDTVERDLVKLVLTVVELLRQLMERQALRRFDEGDLTEDQEERIGLTLMLLEERMAELRDRYGLRPEDLNLDLGPLGPLLPRD